MDSYAHTFPLVARRLALLGSHARVVVEECCFFLAILIKVATWHFMGLEDYGEGALVVDVFFFSGSLLSIGAHHAQHIDFPKEWHKFIALLEKVSPSLWEF